MSEELPAVSPPYVSYGSFASFVTGLKGAMPSRIDRSVFGGMSGGLAYGLLSALKFLRLVHPDSRPTAELRRLANADGEEKANLLREVLASAYPGLFNGDIDLSTATSGQVDEHLRKTYSIAGSTIDKAATFVLSAAVAAGVQLSPQLKGRKPIASGSAGRKLKLKPSSPQPQASQPPQDGPSPSANPPPARNSVDVLVSILDMSLMDDAEQEAVWTLIRFLKRQEAKEKGREAAG